MKKFFAKIFSHFSLIYKIIAIIATALLILVLFPENKSVTYNYSEKGFWSNDDLYAPFDFPILKSDEEVDAEKQKAKSSAMMFYKIDSSAYEVSMQKIKALNIDQDKKNAVLGILPKIYARGLMEPYSGYDVETVKNILVMADNVGHEHSIEEYYNQNDLDSIMSEISNDTTFKALVINSILPNYIFDKLSTQVEYESQISQVSSTAGVVSKGQLIITKGEFVSPEKAKILKSLEFENQQKYEEHFSSFNYNLGKFLLTIIALATLFFFLRLIKHPILDDNKKVTFVLFIILVTATIMAVVMRVDPSLTMIVPLCLAPILVRVFFDIRVSLYIHLANTLILATWVPNSFEFIYYQIIAGMVSIISVKNIERRSNFFTVSVMIFFSYSIVYIAGVLSQDTTLAGLNYGRFAIFFVNALLTLLAYPLIYVLERMFGFVTKLTLLELSSTNNKALRDLSNTAPGTFQHSIQVANISEDLIHEIGGNALLAKVGALYHDIGKLNDSQYFTENQNTEFNPHDNLSNLESAKIIINHVKKGVVLAKKYKLPEVIIDFIRTHHGTTKTTYFYQKQLKEFPDQYIDEQDYMYAGPRPYSRETAVVMLVDSAEAAVKSLKVHNKENISKVIDNVIDGKIKDNQLTNCNITFRDIDRIKQILKNRMISIYHVRIEYPQL